MPRVLTGPVVSDKMDKTVSVAITRVKQHPLYRKQYKVTKKILAHDEDNKCKVGDMVELVESRPISRRKRWQVSKVLKGAKAAQGKS